MASTKSQTFIATATLAVLAGSILGSVSAAPLSGDQQPFGPGAVLSKATNQVPTGVSAAGQHTHNIHKDLTHQNVHIPEGLSLTDAAAMA